MSDKDLKAMVRQGLEELARTAPPTENLADRALASAARQHRRRTAIAASIVVSVAVASALPFMLNRSAPEPVVSGMDPVVADSYLVERQDGSIFAYVFDPESASYEATPYKWAKPLGNRVAVLRRADDTHDELGILNREDSSEEAWISLPRTASTALWSRNGDKVLVSLVHANEKTEHQLLDAFAVVTVSTGTVEVVNPSQTAETPYQWTPKGDILADETDSIAVYSERGRKIQKLKIRGSVPFPLALSTQDELLFLPNNGDPDLYRVVDLKSGAITDRIKVDGKLLGWLCRDELLVWQGANHALTGRDLPVADKDEPALQKFGTEVVIAWPKTSVTFDEC